MSRAIDTQRDQRSDDVASLLLQAHYQYGRSYLSLVSDLWRLTRGPGRLTVDEYFLYRLCDDQRYGPGVAETFVGRNLMLQLAQSQRELGSPWEAFTADKNNFTTLLRGHGLPTPETVALRHPWQHVQGATSLRTAEELAAFLRSCEHYPLFGKPIRSTGSLGVADMETVDTARDVVVLRGGREVDIAELAQVVEQFADGGYLIQRRLVPHPEVSPITAGRVASMRVLVISDEDGPEILRASWKLPVGENVADNFWRKGNLLAGINVETGALTQVRERVGFGTESVARHPDTKMPFEGVVVPLWNEVRQTVLRAASAMSSCVLQGWDVTLTVDGVILVELEGNGGHPMMTQVCADTGLLDDRFRRMVQTSIAKAKQPRGRQFALAADEIRSVLSVSRSTD